MEMREEFNPIEAKEDEYDRVMGMCVFSKSRSLGLLKSYFYRSPNCPLCGNEPSFIPS
jgi:hypothetical protein